MDSLEATKVANDEGHSVDNIQNIPIEDDAFDSNHSAGAVTETSSSSGKRFYANQYQLLAFSLLGSLCNIDAGWNIMVGSGLGVQMICSIVFGLAFLLYYFSVSELSSTFPFAGGSFALARCTLGFFPGYLVGCLEVFYYVLCLALFNAAVANYITLAFPEVSAYLIVFVLLVFVVQCGLCSSRRLFWASVTVIGATAFVLNVIYVFGAIRYAHIYRWGYSTHASNDDRLVFNGIDDNFSNTTLTLASGGGSLFVGSGAKFFRSIPPSLGAYVGPEFVNFACDDVRQPRKQVPIAQIGCALVMLVFNVVMPILASSMAPGAMRVANQLNPLVPSLAQVFGLSRAHALSLELPGLFGMCLCTCYALSKLIVSMAESRLFPPYFAGRREKTGVPLRATVLGLVVALICLVVPAMINVEWLLNYSNIIAILILLVDGTQLIGFIILRIKLSRFPRQFVSPFGICGALVALSAFALSVLSSIGFRADSPTSDTVILVYLAIVAAIYYFVGQHVQKFSAVEKAVMLPVHTEIKAVNGKIFCC
jgi:ethanolamine permease